MFSCFMIQYVCLIKALVKFMNYNYKEAVHINKAAFFIFITYLLYLLFCLTGSIPAVGTRGDNKM